MIEGLKSNSITYRSRCLRMSLTSIHRSQIAQCEHRGGRYNLHVRQYFTCALPRWSVCFMSFNEQIDTYHAWYAQYVLAAHWYHRHHRQYPAFLSFSMDERRSSDPSFLSSMIADRCPMDQQRWRCRSFLQSDVLTGSINVARRKLAQRRTNKKQWNMRKGRKLGRRWIMSGRRHIQ